MRVVHAVRSDAFAGVESSVATLARGLAARGHEVTVVGGDQAALAARAGAQVRVEPATSTAAVALALRRHRGADVVHVHMTAAELAATLALPRRPPAVVATRHFAGPRGSGRTAPLVRWLVGRRLDAEIAVSGYVAAATGGSPVVVRHGVTDDHGSGGPRRPVVAVVSRLEPEKSLPTALGGWARSGLPGRGWRLVVAGEGSQRAALVRLADELGVGRSVDFTGHVADPRLLLREASAAIAPTPVEAFGLVVAEAMATATPVLAADAGAHPELLGERARLFPAGDEQALAALLDGVADDPGAAAAYGERLQRRQRELLSTTAQLDAVEALYEELLSGP